MDFARYFRLNSVRRFLDRIRRARPAYNPRGLHCVVRKVIHSLKHPL